MLKLKLQYFCHLRLGKTEGKRRSGQQKDEMVRQHHRLNGHESEQTPGDSEGQGSLVCCSPWGGRESDTTECLNNDNNVKKKCKGEWTCPSPAPNFLMISHCPKLKSQTLSLTPWFSLIWHLSTFPAHLMPFFHIITSILAFLYLLLLWLGIIFSSPGWPLFHPFPSPKCHFLVKVFPNVPR